MTDPFSSRSEAESEFQRLIAELINWQRRVIQHPESRQTLADSYALLRLAMRFSMVPASDAWLDAFDELVIEQGAQEEFLRRLRLSTPLPDLN